MYRSDLSNYTRAYGGGNQLVTEFVKLVGYVEVHPNSAEQILALFDADVAKVRAAIQAQIPAPPEGE
ncbi:hypothetical protein Paz_46 [Xylella phage Paz]|uniref:Uncharacterized protein n=1 Tax=Xylella phage Paz TaxID=1415145 RepID=V5Q7S3_9CAUD|nr:hypothetical protein Paz_46 [Xylella phage Paz]AHB12143.1 hypothetical protein Paz_46 [Xylella phage Paz]